MAEAPVRNGPSAVLATTVAQYTAPATGWAILRTVHVQNTTTASLLFRLALMPAASANGAAITTATAIYYDIPIPSNGALDWSGFLPLTVASEVVMTQGSAAGLTISLGLVTGP